MRDCITNSNSAACQYAPRHHLPPLRKRSRAMPLVLPGAGRQFKEIAAGRETATA